MNLMDDIDILVSEVGPRDSLQSISPIMPTETKKAWISAEAAAGVREIEVAASSPPASCPSSPTPPRSSLTRAPSPASTSRCTVPNVRGAQAAIEAGAHKITLPLSVSETHSLANLRRTPRTGAGRGRGNRHDDRCRLPERRPHFEGSLSTAFGCAGRPIPDAQIARLAEGLMAAGCDEVGISDTTGYADPLARRAPHRAGAECRRP